MPSGHKDNDGRFESISRWFAAWKHVEIGNSIAVIHLIRIVTLKNKHDKAKKNQFINFEEQTLAHTSSKTDNIFRSWKKA